MGSFGLTEIIILFLIIVIMFGAKRIPDLFRAVGSSIKGFKKEKKVIEDLNRLQGKFVTLHYFERFGKLFWLGDTKYFITKVEQDKTINQYLNDPGDVNSLKDNKIRNLYKDNANIIGQG